jgi:hypothetical protein
MAIEPEAATTEKYQESEEYLVISTLSYDDVTGDPVSIFFVQTGKI